MADVPFATNLLGAIDPYIATAKGTDLSWIGNLPDSYWAGQNQAFKSRNQDLFQAGIPRDAAGNIDWNKASQMALAAGGTAAIPEAVSVGNLVGGQAIVDLNRRLNQQPGAPSLSSTGPPSSAEPAQAEPPTQGTATLRQIAQARGLDVNALVGQTRINPDAPLTYGQRQALAPVLRGEIGEAGANVPATFASRFTDTAGTPPSGAMVGARPVQTVPVQPSMQPFQGQPAPIQQAQAQVAPGTRPPALPAQVQRIEAQIRYYEDLANKKSELATAAGQMQRPNEQKSLTDEADRAGKAAQSLRDSLQRMMEPTTKEKDVNNPAVRAADALGGVDKADAEAYAKDYGSLSTLARSAGTQGLSRVEELKTLTTDPNFYSGPFAKGMQSYRQFQSYFGRDPAAATPMEAFNKGVKDILTEQIKGLAASGVGRVNLAEVRNMQGATATLENSPAGNRAQLEVLRRTYLQQQAIGQIAEGVNQEIASGRIPPGQFRARLNQAVDVYAQNNKIFTPVEQQNPILLGAVDAPADFTRQPLAQARAWGLQRNVHPGDPLHMPDGSYIKAP